MCDNECQIHYVCVIIWMMSFSFSASSAPWDHHTTAELLDKADARRFRLFCDACVCLAQINVFYSLIVRGCRLHWWPVLYDWVLEYQRRMHYFLIQPSFPRLFLSSIIPKTTCVITRSFELLQIAYVRKDSAFPHIFRTVFLSVPFLPKFHRF